MHPLQSYPLREHRRVAALRRKATAAPSDGALQLALGLALAQAGCSIEAAAILRPLRARWKGTADAPSVQAALDAQAWWNKHWRDFVRLKAAGRTAETLDLLGRRAVHYWDLPPLLMHLGDIAAAAGQLPLAVHLYQRVSELAQHSPQGSEQLAFTYVTSAAHVDVLLQQGDVATALAQHRAIRPNAGNALAHELQQARLLVAAGQHDEAMRHLAAMLRTATRERSGYSRRIRLDFVDASPALAPLRKRPDWQALLADPATYARRARR
jgi:tetratricopeptide (TPR) repeat protein